MSIQPPYGNGFRQVVVPVNHDNPQMILRATNHFPQQTPLQNRRHRACIAFGFLLILSPLIFEIAHIVANNFEYPLFQVDSFSISAPNLTSTNNVSDGNFRPITANWSVEILVKNQAKHHDVVFEGIEVSVMYDDDPRKILATATLGGFREVPKKETKFTVHPMAWLEDWVATEIGNDSRADGVVDFGLRVWANSTYTMKITRSRYNRILDVYCRNLRVLWFSSINATQNGMLLGGSKQCSISGALEMHPYH